MKVGIRFERGDAQVNVIGRIDPSRSELVQRLGERVWRRGGEGVRVALLQG